METRIIEETKYYVLVLSDMRGNVDSARPIIGSTELDKLIEFYKKEREPWFDKKKSMDSFGQKHGWNKTFKAGSKLEWFNDISSMNVLEVADPFGCIVSAWVENSANLSFELI